jgi:phosphonopyruvate decarboxylase
MTRERAAEILLAGAGGEDVFICTTGKLSREVLEIRERRGQGHGKDFLTVGSMGHASMIALRVAQEKPERKIWCLDGDGAALMHLGALATIGAVKPANLAHIVLNNAAHETVGGMPTVAGFADLPAVAAACGYPLVLKAWDAPSLDAALAQARQAECLTLVEVNVRLGSRADLGRPTTTPKQNKQAFMAKLAEN